MNIDELSDAVAYSLPYAGVPQVPVSEIPDVGAIRFHPQLGRVTVISTWCPPTRMYGRVVGIALSPDPAVVHTTWSCVVRISDLRMLS